MRKAQVTTASGFTLATVVIAGIVILLIFTPLIANIRNMLLEKHECLNPYNMLLDEIDRRSMRVMSEGSSESIIPIDLSTECSITIEDGRLCLYHQDNMLACKRVSSASFPTNFPFTLEGTSRLSRVKVSVVKDSDGDNVVRLKDETRT
ncbi:MAG: hypothetical protein ABIH34_04895 [Nanoarchaeota archaeon]